MEGRGLRLSFPPRRARAPAGLACNYCGVEQPESAEERESAYELLQRGRELIARRHHAQAAIVLERALRLEPGKASILEALGQAYFNSRQYDRSRVW